MKPRYFLQPALLRQLLALGLLSVILAAGVPSHPARAATPRVAYVYGSGNAALTANPFKTMLNGRNVDVDLFTDVEAMTATFTLDQVIIIGDDIDAAGGFLSASQIRNAGKPVVAIGLWGSQFLEAAALPVVTAGSGFTTTVPSYALHVADPAAPIWSTPSQVSQINQTLSLYTQAVPVLVLNNPAPLQFSTRIGRPPGDPGDYSLMAADYLAQCYSFWGYRGLPNLMTPSAINLFLNIVFGSPCTSGSYTVNSALATSAPVMDGVLNYGEWSLTPNLLEMDHGFAAVMNDNIRLYLLVDVLESVVNNTGVNENDLWVTFDTNNDKLITPLGDLNYGVVTGTHNLRYQYYINPAQWNPLVASTKSSLGPGFDCYTPDNTKILNINTQTFDCYNHQLWEIAIDLKEISTAPGQTIHMGLRTHSPVPDFTDEWPNSFDVDFSNLITVTLASMPIPPHDTNANIAFANPNLEISQVVQDASNTIPLVADKTTAGRVGVVTTGSPYAQPVLEYLYGQRGSDDLPGSPLVQQINAPLNVNRGNLTDTGNFLLPPSWIHTGEVTFHAEASDFNGNNIAASSQLLTFQDKAVPVYWIIQENNGTANAIDLPAQATLNSYESYVKAVFPVPDVTFVQKPWTVLGALNGASLQTNVNDVDAYYNAIAGAYWLAIMQAKQPPYALPQMIFGAANVGGGLSAPTWYNGGNGRAAAGGNASSGEGVVAHEFNHDLDRSASGTWGRHVGACGATGPDPSWPNGNNPAIGEYGFDTRLPWQNNNTSKTVVPTTFPDLMSYCQSGLLPTKWVSPYRYRAWFGSSSFPAAPSTGPMDALYITGHLNVSGTGALDPVLLAPGMPSTPSATGAYSLEVSGLGPTTALAFDVTFQDIEGGALNTVFFNFSLPDPGGVTAIRLRHGAQVLATLTKAAHPPSASFTAPGNGPLSGSAAVSWLLTAGDTPLAGLRQQLEFSADNGSTWIPVATNLPGTLTSLGLDTQLLPMTAQGKLRLVISDGLNNVTVDSPNTFSVANHPPAANILAPIAGSFIPAGSQTLLQGQANDVDEANLPDNHFLWKLDGSTTLGVGRNVQVLLPNGQHTLTLTVLDSHGATGTANAPVFVNIYRVRLPMIRR
jgi:hypothetical protein